MARRKNKRRFDPRYFMNEREEQVNEKIYGPDDSAYEDAHRKDKKSRADDRRERERKDTPDFDLSHLNTPGEKVGWWEDDRFERGELPGAAGSSIEPTAELDFLHPEEDGDLNIPAGVRAYMDRLKDGEKLEEGRNRSMKNIMENFSFDNWPLLNEAPGMFDPEGPEDEVKRYAASMTSRVKPEDLNEDFEDLEET